jgi:hypothetical protein
MAPKDRAALQGEPLSSTAQELLDCFKRIEAVWEKAESKLASTHVPIDVRVKVGDAMLGDEEQPDGQVVTYLAYCKHGKGGRRICLIDEYEYSYRPHGDVEVRPITECPVESRLGMLDWFPKLFEEAESVAKSYVPKIKEALDKFESTLLWL